MVQEIQKKIVKYFLIILGLILLIYLTFTIDFISILKHIKEISFSTYLLLSSLLILTICFKAAKWNFIVKKTFNITLSFLSSIKDNFAGIASSIITPGRADLAKSLLLYQKHNVSLSKSISIGILDRIVEFLAVLIIMLISLLFTNKEFLKEIRFLILLVIIITFIACSFLLFFSKPAENIIKNIKEKFTNKKILTKILNLFEKITQGFAIFYKKPIAFIKLLTLALLWISCGILIFHFTFLSFGLNIPFQTTALAMTSSLIIAVLSFIPGGIGITETSFLAILSLTHIKTIESSGLIVASIVIARIFSLYLPAIIGTIILIKNSTKNSTKKLHNKDNINSKNNK